MNEKTTPRGLRVLRCHLSVVFQAVDAYEFIGTLRTEYRQSGMNTGSEALIACNQAVSMAAMQLKEISPR